MTPRYFDTHSHVNFADYGKDQLEVIGRMRENDVWTITIGTDLATSKEALKLALEHDGIFACIGIHPVDDAGAYFEEEEFENLVSNQKVVAVGECGIDYYRVQDGDDAEKNRQKVLFEKQIQFAIKHDKPLMIHSRSAYDELAEMISIYKRDFERIRGNIHFFSGSLDQAKKFVDLGFTLSFAGPITFARDYDETIRGVPLESILSETDSPFASPTPHRGKRNEPSYVVEVVKKIAEIRGEDFEVVAEALVQNAFRVFEIKG